MIYILAYLIIGILFALYHKEQLESPEGYIRMNLLGVAIGIGPLVIAMFTFLIVYTFLQTFYIRVFK